MNKQEHSEHKTRKSGEMQKDETSVDSLITRLADKNGQTRESARMRLLSIGKPAVPVLIEALGDRNKLVRWEAAKALGQIQDPIAAPPLVKALRDKVFDIRWLAAESLIAIGSDSVVPIIQELLQFSDDPWLVQGAHHVLSHFAESDAIVPHHEYDHPTPRTKFNKVLKPLVLALEKIDPTVEVPLAAKAAFDELTRTRESTAST